MVCSVLSGDEGEPLREPSGSGRGSGLLDLNNVKVWISLMHVVNAIIQINTFFNSHELNLLRLPMLENQVERKHCAAPY